MRFNCGPSADERRERKKQWHLWFAWRPVRVAPGDCRWLEYVERKGEFWSALSLSVPSLACGWDYEYRARQR